MNAFEIVLIALVAVIGGLCAGTFGGMLYARESTQRKHAEQLNQQKESGEARLLELQAQQRDALREAKDETTKIRTSLESENRERRQEIKRQEQRLQQKEEQLDHKIESIERRERQLSHNMEWNDGASLCRRGAGLAFAELHLHSLHRSGELCHGPVAHTARWTVHVLAYQSIRHR